MTHELVAAILAVQAPPAGGSPSFSPLLLQIGLIFLIFYFLIIRPQQKQRKTHEEALKNLKRGDRVVTSGGIIADVIHIKETVTEGVAQRSLTDEITIKSAESRLIVERGRIAKILGEGVSSASGKDSKKSVDPALSS